MRFSEPLLVPELCAGEVYGTGLCKMLKLAKFKLT